MEARTHAYTSAGLVPEDAYDDSHLIIIFPFNY